MSVARVPWHRSLFVRLFALGALIAVVAVVAATWATARTTTVAVRDAQQQTLHDEATIYDQLLGYAATHPDWSGAGPLLQRLARQTGQQLALTDRDGAVLVSSRPTTPRLDPSTARATVDPLALDTALVRVVRSEPSPTPEPATTPCQAPCGRHVVPAITTIDPRVAGPFTDPPDRAAWSDLTRRVDRCLRGQELAPVLALTEDFGAIVEDTGHDTEVGACVEVARRAALQGSVAPAALLQLSGAGPTASVFWDLSAANRWRIGLLATGILLLTLLLSALLAGQLVRPLRRMAAAAGRAGEGELGVRVAEDRRDEVGQMATAFNRMADRRDELEEARRRMVSDVSHELRTPLANIRGWLEAAQDGLADVDESLLAGLYDDTVQLQRLVEDLHQVSLADAGELWIAPEPIDVEAFLAQIADSFGPVAAASGVVLATEAMPGTSLTADPVRLRQAAANLVGNAIRHTPAGGRVTIGGEDGALVVRDTGEGIPAADLPHVFDRFRRVDPARGRATGGSGLGLAIVREIAQVHRGTATIESTLGAGTTVRVTFGPPTPPS